MPGGTHRGVPTAPGSFFQKKGKKEEKEKVFFCGRPIRFELLNSVNSKRNVFAQKRLLVLDSSGPGGSFFIIWSTRTSEIAEQEHGRKRKLYFCHLWIQVALRYDVVRDDMQSNTPPQSALYGKIHYYNLSSWGYPYRDSSFQRYVLHRRITIIIIIIISQSQIIAPTGGLRAGCRQQRNQPTSKTG